MRERKEGIEEILPLVFKRPTAPRVSAAELALFHTGAILSSLGYRPPATASWEHLREDKRLFTVCVEKRLQQLFQTTPSPTSRPSRRRSLSCVHNGPSGERQIFSSVFPVIFRSVGIPLYFSVCFLRQNLS